jgi:hypothetical protein
MAGHDVTLRLSLTERGGNVLKCKDGFHLTSNPKSIEVICNGNDAEDTTVTLRGSFMGIGPIPSNHLKKQMEIFRQRLEQNAAASQWQRHYRQNPMVSHESVPATQGGDVKFCMKCGTQLPKDAASCFKCGAATPNAGTPSPVTPSPSIDEWETAEVEARMGKILEGRSFVSSMLGGRPVQGMQLGVELGNLLLPAK